MGKVFILNKEYAIGWPAPLFLILMLELGVAGITYLAGGTEFTFTHLMYIPIIFSAFFQSLQGAMLAAILGGFLLGPWMPVNVELQIEQTPMNWVLRTLIFMIVGVVVGLLFQHLKLAAQRQIQSSFIEKNTGLPNLSKFRLEVNHLTQRQETFCVTAFNIANLYYLNAHVHYLVGEQVVLKVSETLKNTLGDERVFSIYPDTLASLLPGCTVEEACCMSKRIIDSFQETLLIDGLPVNVDLKCGILNYPLHAAETDQLFQKLDTTLRQSKTVPGGVVIYTDAFLEKRKARYDTAVALYNAIQNHEFSLVYQPIIDLHKHKIKGAEALLRWRNETNHMGPDEFIKIAEDAGFIHQITKWVIENAILQIKKWEEVGIISKIAVNISSDDLKDDMLTTYTRNCLEASGIDPSFLSFELTETVFTSNEKQVKNVLERIHAMGIKIHIDDFGTGYNSMIQLVTLPISHLKIDKFFVNYIDQDNYRAVIGETIRLAHNLKMEVIAEGVETEEQMRQLSAMGCDNIQGYYFSRPLNEHQYAEFYKEYSVKEKI